MTIRELAESGKFTVVNLGEELDREIIKPFCCDLLSIAVGRAPADSVWVTVMGNLNMLAVASLAGVYCVIMAEGSKLDEAAIGQAKQLQITVLATEEPIFEAALAVYGMNTVIVRKMALPGGGQKKY